MYRDMATVAVEASGRGQQPRVKKRHVLFPLAYRILRMRRRFELLLNYLWSFAEAVVVVTNSDRIEFTSYNVNTRAWILANPTSYEIAVSRSWSL
jgi:hypothetical protein